VDEPKQPTIETPEKKLPAMESAAAAEPIPNWLFTKVGLRPIWCVVVFYVLFWLFSLGLGRVAFRLVSARASRLWGYFGSELAVLLAALLAAVVMTALDGKKFSEYGLPPRPAFGRMFWIGSLWGMASISVMLLAMHGAHLFDFGHIELHGARMVKFALFWGGFFLLVGLYEEFYFRGYFLFTLTRTLRSFSDDEESPDGSDASPAASFWVAAVILCSFFGFVHLANTGESPLGIVAAACIGLFFCLTLRRTGNLWFAVGFHTMWDWAQSFLYSVPDSGTLAPGHLLSSSLHGPPWLTGGSVGPEGSVLVFVVIASTAAVFDRVYRVKVPGS
jgi:membrane protease YdiL (CAAX protease family)